MALLHLNVRQVYLCDFAPGNLEGRVGGIDWFTKYQIGEMWIEYLLLLHGKRPNEFNHRFRVIVDLVRPIFGRLNEDVSLVNLAAKDQVLILVP